ncbi:MAG: DUF1840 domain-containing protein [Burkholderiales bacterium]|nr:DUF1840 domain-containing protein [Burkholderiales bacterium]MDE2398249.1 DUF1840 domain-containing protein [Burkholderiales bacterium]MDE2457045.1 DUF1840 domain-containing protein [Burkholderiales bacterium]
MIYKFRSKASGDVIMLGPHGDLLLTLIGREPAPQGIIEPDAMAAALSALRAAAAENASTPGGEVEGETPVGLRQRLWPMIDLLERSLAAREPVVWGV